MTGPGAFWYNGAAAQVLAGGPITGTAALSVTQPAIAASGTNTQPPITGTAALSANAVLAASGTFTPLAITGTAALTANASLAAVGTIPVTNPVGGGMPIRRPSFRKKRRPEREIIYDLARDLMGPPEFEPLNTEEEDAALILAHLS